MESTEFEISSLSSLHSGNTFSGSFKGLRFFVKPTDDALEVSVWPEPFSLEAATERAPEQILSRSFSFDEEGHARITGWLHEQWELLPPEQRTGRLKLI